MDIYSNTEFRMCFACGQDNPFGLKLRIIHEPHAVLSDFTPLPEHQGFPGIVHGGIIATALDEIMVHASVLADQPAWMMTGRLEIRYRRYVPFGPLLRVRAELAAKRGRLMQATSKIMLAEDEGVVFAEATGSFMELPPSVLDEVMKEYPTLRSSLSK